MQPRAHRSPSRCTTSSPTSRPASWRRCGPDGMLSVTPVGLMFDGEYVRFSTTKDRKKYRNLRRDDRVTMAVAHRNNPNRYVEVRGRALLEDDDDHAFIDSIAHHYMGVDRYPFDRPGQERVTVTIVAQHVSTPRSRSPTTRRKRATASWGRLRRRGSRSRARRARRARSLRAPPRAARARRRR